ncbi:MAG: hypothetical protein K2O91_26775, partial [Lachnospiraceae bacterium]|nr:hypothetical protein [Lachnospiraceae bacterium]
GGLIDNHPSVMMIHYDKLNEDIFWLCVYLSMEKAEDILTLFWTIMDKNALDNPAAFSEKFSSLLVCGNKYTSQELFIMFYIAYMYMYGKDITETDIKDMVIYWGHILWNVKS